MSEQKRLHLLQLLARIPHHLRYAFLVGNRQKQTMQPPPPQKHPGLRGPEPQ